MHWYVWSSLLAVLVFCCWTDLTKRLIYDKVTLPGILHFAAVHCWVRDLSAAEMVSGLLGLGGIGIFIAWISKGQLGGGDIKLLAMIGTATGASVGMWILLLTFLTAGLLAWPVLLWRRWKPVKEQEAAAWPMAPFMMIGTLGMLWLTV